MSDDREQPDDGGEPTESGDRSPRESQQAVTDYDNFEQDVFRNIYGHHGSRVFLGAALRDGDTHVLLEGPPGSGKSVFLLALEENVPGTIYRDGDQITAASLRDALKDDPPILLIDEIDALDTEAYDVLSLPLEHGRLVRDSARESYDVEVDTQVIAACNHADELPEHIANRFQTQEFEEYGDEEFLELCEHMLVSEIEWIDSEAEARKAAEKIYSITGEADPRSTRDIARMSRSIDEIDTLATAMDDPDADVEVQPLFPGEIKRAQGEVGKVHLRKTLTQEMVGQAGGASSGDEPQGSDAEDGPPAEGESEVEDEIEAAVEEAVAEA